MPIPKSSAQQEQYVVTRGQPRKHLNARIEQDIDHQRPAPTVTISQQPEEHRADRAHHQAGCEHKCDIRDGFVKILCELRENIGENEEIERVERPA